jgi:hypothetical protein
MPRLMFSGRYVIRNQAIIEDRANRSSDPRHIFYRAMLENNTYEAYEAAVGTTKVLVQTWNPPGWVSGHREMGYVCSSRNRWIRNA